MGRYAHDTDTLMDRLPRWANAAVQRVRDDKFEYLSRYY